MSPVQIIEVAPEEAALRLDRWFKRRFPQLAHGRLERLLRTGQVRVDGRRAAAGLRLEAGQKVRVPPLGEAEPAARPALRPHPADERMLAALRRAVLYRDEEVLAIDKPPGLAVQGGTETPVHLDLMLDGLRFGAAERPRLVHRLDKDTSGVLLLARTARAAAWLAEAFRRKGARKVYWAVTVGVPHPSRGRIDLPLGKLAGRKGERVAPIEDGESEGRRAVTYYAVVEHAGREAAWLALMPVTGRTHQLRVHCAAIGTPILGDGKYGGAAAQLPGSGLARRLHLHARRIRLPRPQGGWIDVTAPLPPHMRRTWQFFGFDAEPVQDPFAELDAAS